MSNPFLMKGRAPSSPYNGQNRRTFQGRGCKDPMPLFLLRRFLLPPRLSVNTIFKTERTAPGACVHLAQGQSGVSCSPECCGGQDSLLLLLLLLQKGTSSTRQEHDSQLYILLVPRGTESPRGALPWAVLTLDPK